MAAHNHARVGVEGRGHLDRGAVVDSGLDRPPRDDQGQGARLEGQDGTKVLAHQRRLAVELGLYAVGVLVVGFVRRRVQARWIGLAFLALTLVKLGLYDIWSLGRVYQMVIMIGVGGLLLAAGFLYARYAARVKQELFGEPGAKERP